ncbi:hypothetical protein [Herbiconiux sp. VKM Ac-2851]|uniref:hypothetical protein n=1 Tax=Herbiconiux sp. VKM Ac-2851 TaxID=2739025 RepID=UPI001564373E|nr:hypothetical protein [Herbiconiux sp. VKM Ac-2851]NQX37121.1 hypothetical protein [Herbiconiux sp. VKM Ac-2851]
MNIDDEYSAHGDPIHEGDRLLLHPMITGLSDLAWGEVEIVDVVEDPTSLPWNAGPAYPYRVGYRVDVTSDEGAASHRGTLWLNADGHDPVVGVRRIDSAALG